MMATTSKDTLPPWWKRDVGSLFKRSPKQSVADTSPTRITLPQVDLLPQSVRDLIALRRIRNITILLVVIVLSGVFALWTWWGQSVSTAERDLEAVTAQNAAAQAQVNKLTPVETLVRQISREEDLLVDALASQPEAAEALGALFATAARVASGSVDLESLTVTFHAIPQPGGVTNPCPDPLLFSDEITIGCVSFNATASSRLTVAEFLTAMEAEPRFVGPYVNTTTLAPQTDGSNRVTFSGSTGLGPEFLATPLSPEQIEQILAPPAPPTEDTATETDAEVTP